MSWLNHLTKFSSESYKHFVAKAILFYELRKMKHNVTTEWRVPNGYIDVVDKDTMTFYEIENSKSPKFRSRKFEQYDIKGYEIIIVDCSNMPDDINEIYEYLRQFIIID